MGDKSSDLFPALAFGASFLGLQLPDAMGHASGDIGLVEGLRSIPFAEAMSY